MSTTINYEMKLASDVRCTNELKARVVDGYGQQSSNAAYPT